MAVTFFWRFLRPLAEYNVGNNDAENRTMREITMLRNNDAETSDAGYNAGKK